MNYSKPEILQQIAAVTAIESECQKPDWFHVEGAVTRDFTPNAYEADE